MKFSTKACLKTVGEVVLGLLLLFCITAGLLAWRLSQGPIDLDKSTPYFVDYFNDNNAEKISIESLVLTWGGFENPLGLSASKVTVSNDNGPFLYSPQIDLNIRLVPLLLGKFELEAVWIRQIILSITKHENGAFTITGQPLDETIEDDKELLPASLTLNDLIYDLPDLDYFWIDDARIIYRDARRERTKTFEPVTLYIKNNKEIDNEKNLSGFLSFPFGEDSNSNIVRMNFQTSQDPLLLNVYGEFQQTPLYNFLQFAPTLPEGLRIRTVVDAEIALQLDNTWSLHSMNAVLKADEGKLRYPINDATNEVDFNNLSVALTHDANDDILSIKNLSARVNDQVDVAVTGQLASYTEMDSVSGSLDLSVTNLPQDYFNRYWPKDYTDNGAYKWLTQRIQGGTFPKVDFQMVFDQARQTREDEKPLPPWLLSAKGDFSYEGLTIDYNAPMQPATEAIGTGTYNDVELTLDIASAKVGAMDTREATLNFDDLISRDTGKATMTFPVTAQAQDVFDYIAAEPIKAFDNVAFNPRGTSGDVDALVKIDLPLLADLPIEEVKVSVEGTLTNANIPNAVKGLTISGGPYAIAATTEDIKIEGSGQIAGQPIDLLWHEYFSSDSAVDYLSKIDASLTANDTIRAAFIEGITEYFEGPTKIDLDYVTDKNGGSTAIDVALDLSDTDILLKEVGLIKTAGQGATAKMKVGLVNGDLNSISNLSIAGDAISLGNGSLNFTNTNGEPSLTKATLDLLQFQKNNISVVAAQEGDLLKTSITGNYLDISPLLQGEKENIRKVKDEAKTTTRPIEIGITVNELQTSETGTLKQPKIYARLNGDAQIERFELDAFLGQTAQNGKLYIRYQPDVQDGLSLRVETDNAGELFRTLDLYPYIQGGTLQIAGRPIEGGRFGDVEGRARINDFEVTNAPAIIRLVNSFSFKNILQGGALRFTRLESDFEWRIGDAGDIYTVTDGQTSGAAIALTFDGFVNTATDNMEINGTAAPLSELNSFIGNIPIVGQILTGGSAFWAATYSVYGNPEDPGVSVNPLSVITPGILRKLLFENAPTQPELEQAPTAAQ